MSTKYVNDSFGDFWKAYDSTCNSQSWAWKLKPYDNSSICRMDILQLFTISMDISKNESYFWNRFYKVKLFILYDTHNQALDERMNAPFQSSYFGLLQFFIFGETLSKLFLQLFWSLHLKKRCYPWCLKIIWISQFFIHIFIKSMAFYHSSTCTWWDLVVSKSLENVSS